jgi:phosphopantothenoylcysteine decarboxylase/phosphopantothenate--cysteine ligase
LAGRRLVVTAGGTREALDPVRYLGNASSGKQGFAIAAEAARRGADVTLIAANAEPPTPPGVRRVDVVSAAELGAAVAAEAPLADAVVMAAAVADFRPAEAASAKIKRAGRDGLSLRLVANPDILAGLVAARRPGQVVVGFAAETGDADGSPLDHARRKAAAKGADLTVANQVGAGLGIGADVNRVWLLGPDGQVRGEAAGAKAEVARVVTDGIVRLLTPR